MTGSSIFDYVHQSDHIELAEQLGVRLAHQQRLVSSEEKCDSNHNSGGSPAIPDGNSVNVNELYICIYICQYAHIFLVCYPVTSLMHAKTDRTTGKPSYDRAFCIRMKSTLTKRGCHFKSSGYRVTIYTQSRFNSNVATALVRSILFEPCILSKAAATVIKSCFVEK